MMYILLIDKVKQINLSHTLSTSISWYLQLLSTCIGSCCCDFVLKNYKV